MPTEFELTTKLRRLKAGISVFSNHGWAVASIRQIAELAGTNIAAAPYHYGSKKELWKAVITYLQYLLVEVIFADQAKWREMTLYEGVRNTTRNYIRICAMHPEMHRITLSETIHGLNEFIGGNSGNSQ